jgi:4-carboxymuconolactone decarboxylase
MSIEGNIVMSESYLKGLEEIARIDPESGLLFVEELKKISPDFAEYFVEFAFGKVHARRILDSKMKELVAIASLVALGDGKSHLHLRIVGAMRVGCTKEEIIEVIIQNVVYVGFTRAMAAMNAVREACAEDANVASEELVRPTTASPRPAGQGNREREKSGPRSKPGGAL